MVTARIAIGILLTNISDVRIIQAAAAQLELVTVILERDRLVPSALASYAMIIADEADIAMIRDMMSLAAPIATIMLSVVRNVDSPSRAVSSKGALDGRLALPNSPAEIAAQLGIALYAHRAIIENSWGRNDTQHLDRRIFQSLANGLSIADASRHDLPLIYVNPAFEAITGYSAEEVIGKNCRFLQGREQSQPCLTGLRAAIAAGEQITVVLRNYRRDGRLFWNELFLSPIRDRSGLVTHYVGIQNDVTERVQMQEALRASERLLAVANEKLQHLAITDGLTGLHNRRAFEERLISALERIQKKPDPLILLMIDMDYFKQINDRHGHLAGDQVLVTAASSLRATLRAQDMVARYGGDEFAVLLPGTSVAEALAWIDRLQGNLDKADWPYGRVSLSIGVVEADAGIASPDALIDRADQALYDAKAQGRARIVVYAPKAMPAEVRSGFA